MKEVSQGISKPFGEVNYWREMWVKRHTFPLSQRKTIVLCNDKRQLALGWAYLGDNKKW